MNIPEIPRLICILGPTASGKTLFAANLAHQLGGEVISADSRQVYRGMDIGTGKDYNDYMVEGRTVPYHLIDIVDAGEEYNVFQYQKDFYKVFTDLQNREKVPVLCGGTGMYIEAVLKGYKLIQAPVNEALRSELSEQPIESLVHRLQSYRNPHNTTDTIIRKRLIRAIEIEEYLLCSSDEGEKPPAFTPIIFGLEIDRDARRERITARLKQRLENGLIEEVQKLLDSGVSAEKLEFYGLEYKFVCQYLTGLKTCQVLFESLNTAIHQFAKRQMTWFRKMEKEGIKINWIDALMPLEEKLDKAKKILEGF